MPEEQARKPVGVVGELLQQPRLADAGITGDRHEPRDSTVKRAVEQLLEQPQIGIASGERRLEARVPATATSAAHHPQGPPQLERLDLPLTTCSPASSNRIAPEVI